MYVCVAWIFCKLLKFCSPDHCPIYFLQLWIYCIISNAFATVFFIQSVVGVLVYYWDLILITITVFIGINFSNILDRCQSLLSSVGSKLDKENTLRLQLLFASDMESMESGVDKLHCDTTYPANTSRGVAYPRKSADWVGLVLCWGGCILLARFHCNSRITRSTLGCTLSDLRDLPEHNTAITASALLSALNIACDYYGIVSSH